MWRCQGGLYKENCPGPGYTPRWFDWQSQDRLLWYAYVNLYEKLHPLNLNKDKQIVIVNKCTLSGQDNWRNFIFWLHIDKGDDCKYSGTCTIRHLSISTSCTIRHLSIPTSCTIRHHIIPTSCTIWHHSIPTSCTIRHISLCPWYIRLDRFHCTTTTT